MKILLLAHAFPPYNASGSVRAAKFAEFLLARGHDVRVLTGDGHSYPPTLTTTVPADRITTAGWWRIEAPLDALRTRLAGRIGREASAASQDGGGSGPANPSFAARAVIAYRSMLSIPDAQVGWIGPATRTGRGLMATWKPDLIYSTALPFSSHVVAAQLARTAGIPWVGEFRDLYSGNPYTDLWQLRRRLDQALERRVMSSVAAVVSISEPLTVYLAGLHGKPAATIMNGYDPGDFVRAPDMAPDFDPTKITIIYTGIIYPGRRDPAVLFEALRRLGEARHHFEIRFYGPNLEVVSAAARQAGIGDIVRTLPPVPHLTALGLQRSADALLLLLWDSPLEQGVLTGKLFEYAGAGKPVISLGCVDGVAANLVRERNLGLATTCPDAVAAFLSDLLNRKQICNSGSSARLNERDAAEMHGLTRTDQFVALEQFLGQHGLLRSPEARQ